MAKPKLTNDDFCKSAKRLRCDVAGIKAVSQIESPGGGFYADGFPVILFERHLFRKLTQGRYNKDYPEISGAAGNYGAAGANQRRKFALAYSLNPQAAMKSCSWGKYQILGLNHAVCGYKTVDAFVDAMKESEAKHLDAFVSFVIGNGLADNLRNHDWAGFARGYNGAGFAKHNYHGKIANAYAKFAKENIDCSSLGASTTTADTTATDSNSPIDEPQDTSPPTNIETTPVEAEDGVLTSTTTPVQEEAEIEGVKPYNDGKGLGGTLKDDAKAILPANIGLSTVSEWIQQTTGWPAWVSALIPKLVVIALVCTALWLIYRLLTWAMHNFRENERVKLLAIINSDKSRKDIVLK